MTPPSCPRVLNKYKDKIPEGSVYIGRPSKWGNPFPLQKGGDREAVYKQYCDWLDTQPELIEQAKVELKGKNLICYCAPKRCHGDRLLEVANSKPTTIDVPVVLSPHEDSITHINMYSKGKTDLGRALTHFAPIGFEHPQYGKFASVEAFWFWASTGKKWDHLKPLTGFKAKQEGKLLEVIKYPEFMREVEFANKLKILQNEKLKEAFVNSTLPLTHYYAYGDGPDAKAVLHWTTPWFEYYFTKLRKELRGELPKGLKVIVAGSRHFKSHTLVKSAIEASGFHIAELVSGVADGPDREGLRYANQRFIPVKEFPADWETHGKRAGMIRNAEMADYADVLVAIWDGQSVGTKNMIDEMKRRGKQVYVMLVQ